MCSLLKMHFFFFWFSNCYPKCSITIVARIIWLFRLLAMLIIISYKLFWFCWPTFDFWLEHEDLLYGGDYGGVHKSIQMNNIYFTLFFFLSLERQTKQNSQWNIHIDLLLQFNGSIRSNSINFFFVFCSVLFVNMKRQRNINICESSDWS